MKKTILTILAVLAVATSVRADLLSDYTLSNNEAFLQRVAMAIFRASMDIKADVTVPLPTESELALARSVTNISVARQYAGWLGAAVVGADPDLRYAYEQGDANPANDDQSDIGDASIINGVNGALPAYALELFPPAE